MVAEGHRASTQDVCVARLAQKFKRHCSPPLRRCTINHAIPVSGAPYAHTPQQPLQSRIEEIGQALLRNTLLTAPDGLRRMQQGSVTGGAGGGYMAIRQADPRQQS